MTNGDTDNGRPTDLLLVGCGKMGTALLRGWLAAGDGLRVHIVDPQGLPVDVPSDAVAIHARADDLPDTVAPSVLVLAVKPQTMPLVLPAYRRFLVDRPVLLSIAAGRTLAFFETTLGTHLPLVRCMPNTPAAVGRGISVCVANAQVDPVQRALCDRLMRAVGDVAWIDDESQMDVVTAVSGGGPAYVFLLIECLAQAGVAAGLPADLALRLARSTVIGSGELARLADEPVETLRRNVTSPGGTTAEALAVLMGDSGLQPLMDRAIAAAAARSRVLAG